MFPAWTYRPRPGAYNALDERARILLAACGVAASVATWHVPTLAALLAVALAIVAAARLRFAEVRRFALFATFLVAFLVALTWLTSDAPPAERARDALAQALRMYALVAFALVLPFTLDPTRYGLALRRLGLGDRLAFAIELAFRFVPAFALRFERTLAAQSARGLELDAARLGLLERLRRTIPLLVPVCLDAIVAGEDLADAMDLRAFGTGPRTWCGETRFGAREWSALALGAGLVALAVVPRAAGGLG